MSNKRLSSSQRSFLTKKSHRLSPVVMLGKHGLTEALLGAINSALDCHELIKIKFIDFKSGKRELSLEIETKTSSKIVQIIGNVLILYKQNSDTEKRKIKLPE